MRAILVIALLLLAVGMTAPTAEAARGPIYCIREPCCWPGDLVCTVDGWLDLARCAALGDC
jgi:hypothetical protein